MKKLFIFLTFFLFSSIIYSQNEDKKESPKELMSSYYNDDFNPFDKGNWVVSFNMSFKKEDFQNSEYNFEKIVDGTQKNSKYEIAGGYFFSDNFAGRMGVFLGRNSFEGRVERTLDTISRTNISKSYGVVPSLRSAIPLTHNNRLSIYVDLVAQVGWGKTDYSSEGIFDETENSESKEFSFGTGIRSGVVFFAMQNFAIEIGLDVLSYQYTSSITNEFEKPESKYETNEIDFSIDLLNLNLSLSYYIGSKKNNKN